MWELGTRAVIVLVSALSGCVFLYNVWGPIFLLTISLFLTIYACYSLIINDCLLSPHAFLLLDYCKHAFFEVRTSFEAIIDVIYQYIRQFLGALNRRFRKRHLTQIHSRMERRRGLHYQLSSDPYPTRKSSSSFESITQLSPIPKNLQKTNMSNDISTNNSFYHNSGHSSYDHSSFVTKHTSMLMSTRNKEELENQTSPSEQILSKRASPIYGQNHDPAQEENTTYFAAEGSTWSSYGTAKTDIKPREKKVGQAVAGPLLTSTRYNIDPKIYNDVTSPGLTARLTKYAAEASSKLTHQSKYHVGQFPKVNLYASSIPLINAKSVRTRTPVTVRVAPSHTMRYSSPLKQNILMNLHQSDNSCSSPSVAQALREISLKRHASREDFASDLAKKQRTDSIANKEFEVHNETKQKRSREESLKSEGDSSPQSNTVRPTKRTKTPSCYDIINSLSSSKHVVSGVKRKARDFSRSGTPDFEKHFKSLECVQNASTQTLSHTSNANQRHHSNELMEKRNNSDPCNYVDKLQEHSPLKGILKTSNKSLERESDDKHIRVNTRSNVQNSSKGHSIESIVSTDSTRLTHKLFMRAEPERNEKLRMLVEEQGNIRAKFTTDDVEEIKKEDITDMRQTSMKARLQSMFDAISGKSASQINPDVVIQAEEVNAVKSVTCPVTCVTLNSSTTTTNVNTTPISTSAVVPSPGTSELNTKLPKHVGFTLPNKDISSNANIQFASPFERKVNDPATSVTNKMVNATSGITFTTKESNSISQLVVSNANTTNPMNTNIQNFNFGKPSLITSMSGTSTTHTTFASGIVSPNSKSPLVAPVTSGIFGNTVVATPMSAAVTINTSVANTKNEPPQIKQNINVSQAAESGSLSSNVSTESGGVIFTSTHTNPVPSNMAIKVEKKEQNAESTSIAFKTNAIPFTGITSIASSDNITTMTSTVNTSTSLFTFGSKINNAPTTTKSEGFASGSIEKPSENNKMFGCPTTTEQTPTICNAITTSNYVNGTQVNSVTNVTTSTGFDANAKTSVPTFGPSTNSTFASQPWPTSSTGGNSNATLFTIENNKPAPSFGTTSSTTGNATQFVSNTSSIFTNSPSTSSIFGATTTTNRPVFGATSSTLNTTTTTFAIPKNTTTSVFGPNVNTTSMGFASTNSIPIFSNVAGGSSVGTANTTAIPVFGSSTNTPVTGITTSGITSVGTNLFSGTNTTTSTSIFPTTNNIFGQANSSTAPSFKNNTGAIGNNNASTLFFLRQNLTPSSNFGSTNVPLNNASVPGFTAPNTVTSDFGSQNQNKGNPGAQNSGTQNFGVGSSIFRGENTAGPVFGASNSGTTNFSSSAPNNTFPGQNAATSSNSTFSMATAGSANGIVTFGDNNKLSPFGTQPSTFGTPNVSTPRFGNTNANENNTTASIFTFGANQKPGQQNTTAFSFGSNNTNNNVAAPSSGPFQFGTTTSNSAAGFNFTAASTTPSINFGTTSSTTTFNASAPGMFSIGSGSTAPRSRNTRTRKLR